MLRGICAYSPLILGGDSRAWVLKGKPTAQKIQETSSKPAADLFDVKTQTFPEAPSFLWLAGGMGAFGMLLEEIKENGPAGLSTSARAQEPVIE